jgi:ribonuclease Z
MHGDHIFGLFGLLSSFQLLGRKHDLHIHGPGELRDFIGFYTKNFAQGQDYQIIVHPVGHKRSMMVFEDEKVEVFSIPLKHRIPVTGYLFREKAAELNVRIEALQKYRPDIATIVQIKKGADLVLAEGKIIPNKELTLPPWKRRSYAYISDTSYLPKIVDLVKDVDLLYHEATFEARDAELAKQTMHSTSAEAAKIAVEASAGKLLLGHFSSRYKNLDQLLEDARSIFPEAYTVNDGDEFAVERIRVTGNNLSDSYSI